MHRLNSRRAGGAAVALVVAAILLWLVRPLWQGIALGLWTSPLVWLPPVLVLVAGALAYRRSRRWTTLEELQEPRRPPPYLAAFPILAFVLFIAGNALTGTLVARALATDTNYEAIRSLPAGGQVRIVPREVAEQNASSAFNSSTETLTDFRIVNTTEGLVWSALRTPQGAFRVFNRKSQGLVELDAEQTARSLTQKDQELAVAPGLQITDNLRWRLLKRRFLVELTDPVGIETPRGPRIMVPYISRSGILVRKPVLGGVFLVAPDGSIEDLEPAEAAARPELAVTGRIYPDTLARQVQDAYAYRGGVWNKWFVHENQTEISDTEENRQPYLIVFPGSVGPQWVTVAEPYGRAFAASAIFLTDARTGRTRIWRVPQGTSLSGNRRALQAVRAISIPGIDFGQGSGTGNFRVVEPRPVFVPRPDDPERGGRLVYLTSIIPTTANAVSKTVIVDAETNKQVEVFENDNDPQAEENTQTFLATARLPGDATGTPATPANGNGNGATPSGAGTNGRNPTVDQRLERLLERQRQLLEDTEALQEALRGSRTP